MAQIVVVDQEVVELLAKIKGSSIGLLELKCSGDHVATLVRLGLARVQEGDETGGLTRVKALPAAWAVEVRTE